MLFFFARGAVAAHRVLLKLLYFGPMNAIVAILEMPQTLLQTPPVLCIVALVVRQLIGRTILNAEIPPPVTDGNDDVMAMAKKGITNFLKSNFPTAVGLYSAFTHVRSDMYVV